MNHFLFKVFIFFKNQKYKFHDIIIVNVKIRDYSRTFWHKIAIPKETEN